METWRRRATAQKNIKQTVTLGGRDLLTSCDRELQNNFPYQCTAIETRVHTALINIRNLN